MAVAEGVDVDSLLFNILSTFSDLRLAVDNASQAYCKIYNISEEIAEAHAYCSHVKYYVLAFK